MKGVVKSVRDINNELGSAAFAGDVKLVKLLLDDERAYPAADSIRYAAKNGHADVVELLLADGRADPCANSNMAIWLAAYNGHTDVVKLLLADGRANPTAAAIQVATENRHFEVVELLKK